MYSLEAEFLLGIEDFTKIPNYSYPEFAFIGRSNVGKSSLLNSITNKRNLAKVSSTPGKTKQINFFLISKKIIFADLPGFGYASVSKSLREKWLKLNKEYLLNRENLKMIFVLIDSRHEPLEIDLGLIEMLENGSKNYMIILTKTDKINKNLLDSRIEQFKNVTQYCQFCKEIMPYSVKTGIGRNQLLAIINKFSKNG